jgi:hypothetical protein
MRKIIVGAEVSMDGVMQAPSGPNEDPTKTTFLRSCERSGCGHQRP